MEAKWTHKLKSITKYFPKVFTHRESRTAWLPLQSLYPNNNFNNNNNNENDRNQGGSSQRWHLPSSHLKPGKKDSIRTP